jgi:hypothetical protein
MMDDHVVVSGAVEGDLDEAVLHRLIKEAGADLKSPYGKKGKQHLKQRLTGYNSAAHHSPWVVLMDLDHDADCAPPLKVECLPDPARYMCFRIAVRAIETWLLADRQSIARFLSVAVSQVPSSPEILDNPKHSMVELARHSRRREIRESMVPRPGSGRKVGSLYNSQLIEFTQTRWKPNVAAQKSDSLSRCRKRIHELIINQTDKFST